MDSSLEEIKKGASWQNIYDVLWHIGTVRYVTSDLLKKHYPQSVWRKKIVTPSKINKLIEQGYLNHGTNDVLMITQKSVDLLDQYSKYNAGIIKLPSGKGERDTLYNSEILLQVLQLPWFFALFYPSFKYNSTEHQPFLIPDGVLLLRNGEKAKLIFLEIENKKPKWQQHLQGKQWKYEALAKKETTYEWWCFMCEKLKIKSCTLNDFGFTVWCIGEFQTDWYGWQFMKGVK